MIANDTKQTSDSKSRKILNFLFKLRTVSLIALHTNTYTQRLENNRTLFVLIIFIFVETNKHFFVFQSVSGVITVALWSISVSFLLFIFYFLFL